MRPRKDRTVIGMIVMTLALLGWSLVNLFVAMGRPLPGLGRVKVLAIFSLFPEPWDRIVGAGANVVMGFALWAMMLYYVWLPTL